MQTIPFNIANSQYYVELDDSLNPYSATLIASKFGLSTWPGLGSEPPIVTISYYQPSKSKQWTTGGWKHMGRFVLYSKEVDGTLYFHIQLSYVIHLIPKMIINCLYSSLMRQRDLLLIHGMLFKSGKVLYGQPYSGKTTKARSEKEGDVLSDDEVLVDLENKLAYPLPYFYFDAGSIFNGKNTPFKPVELTSIESIGQKSLFDCSTIYLSQPYAERENVFDCAELEKWSSFDPTFAKGQKQRIREIIKKHPDICCGLI